MKIKHNYVPKEQVRYCKESFTMNEALSLIEEVGYRCVPVLDNSGTKFLGNIYKIHILEAIRENKELINESIDNLITEKESFIYEEYSFFKVFFTIRKLPFIAVLNEGNEFVGILTHAKVMDVLEDSWGVKSGGYTLTIVTSEYKGALKKIINILNKKTNIEGTLTLDNGSKLYRRIVVTLPKEKTIEEVEELKTMLDKSGFKTVSMDKMIK